MYDVIYDEDENIKSISFGVPPYSGNTCRFIVDDNLIKYSYNIVTTGTLDAFISNISFYIYDDEDRLLKIKIYDIATEIDLMKHLNEMISDIEDMDYSVAVIYSY